MVSALNPDGLNEFVNEDQPQKELVIIPELADDEGGFDSSIEGAEYLLPGILEVISDTRMKIDLTKAIRMDLSREPKPERGDRTRYLKPIVAHTKTSSQKIYEAFLQGKKVLSLGGNHVRGFGVLGALRACHALGIKMGMVWVDAHPDANTPESTVSGHMHGQPAGFLLGQGGPRELLALLNDAPFIDPRDFIYVGINAIDNPKNDDGSPRDKTELSILRELIKKGVKCFPMNEKMRKAKTKDVMPKKVKKAIQKLSDRLQSEGGKLWVEWDVDSVDMKDMPAAAMDNKNGLSGAQIRDLFNYIGSNCSVDGVGVSELVPAKDREEKAKQLVAEAVGHLFGVSNPNYSIHMDRSRKEMAGAETAQSEETPEPTVAASEPQPSAMYEGLSRRDFTGRAAAAAGGALVASILSMVGGVLSHTEAAEETRESPVDGIKLTDEMGFMNFETNPQYRDAWKLGEGNTDVLHLFEETFAEQARHFPEICNVTRSPYQQGQAAELSEDSQRSLSWMLTLYHLARLRVMQPESGRTVEDVKKIAAGVIREAYRQHREQGGKGRNTMADEGVAMFLRLYEDFVERVRRSHSQEDIPRNDPFSRVPDRSLQHSLEVNGYLPNP